MLTAVRTDGFFLQVSGLPVHPLVVHAAVVLLPLSALGLVAIVLVPRWRRPLGWVVLAGLLIGAGAAFLAKESGEALANVVGQPADHARWGDVLPVVALLLFVVAAVWFWLWRRDDQVATASSTRGGRRIAGAGSGTRGSVATMVTGVVSVVAAVVVLGLTFVVGHSGAEAVWAGRLPTSAAKADAPVAHSTPTPSPTAATTGRATTAPSGTTSSAASGGRYTMAQVRAHASPGDCWAAVGGKVYDLTDWIAQHPGGPGAIEQLCGTDGTSAFDAQHGGQSRPEQELSQFLLGPLAS